MEVSGDVTQNAKKQDKNGLCSPKAAFFRTVGLGFRVYLTYTCHARCADEVEAERAHVFFV